MVSPFWFGCLKVIPDLPLWGGEITERILRYFGEPHRAIEYYQQARALAQAIGVRRNEAIHSWNLGLLLEGQGELPRAVELMQVRVDFLRAIGHPDAEKAAARVEQIRQKLK